MLISSPQTDEERVNAAAMCVVRLSVKPPAVLDGLDSRVERVYTGWPDRLYIVGTDRRIKYKSAPGPYGFSTRDLEAALTNIAKGS